MHIFAVLTNVKSPTKITKKEALESKVAKGSRDTTIAKSDTIAKIPSASGSLRHVDTVEKGNKLPTKEEMLALTPDDMYALYGTTISPSREKCALLALHTLREALAK